MKFRLKITLYMLCLLSLLFGIGGSALIAISFYTSLERERESAYETYQMLLDTLQVVNSIETWKSMGDLSEVLTGLLSRNASSWSALRVSSKTNTVYENGTTAEFLELTPGDTDPESCLVTLISTSEELECLRLSGSFMIGDDILRLDALRDITSIYEMREQQRNSYRMIYLFMLMACVLLTYSISWVLTRPLVKLTRASKEIARGNLSYRSDVMTDDEIGALSQEFDHMAAETQKHVEELKEAMERQQRFTRSFTHELKTPMSSMIGYADLLRRQALTPDEQAEAANYIFTAGKRLENLSIKLLDIFVADKRELSLRKVSLSALIEKIANAQRERLSEKQIEIFTKCGSGTCCVDSDLIWSLLVNLIDNAQKAIHQGGRIYIASEITQDGCRIRVTDNGRGIPPEAMEHITEAFYRGDPLCPSGEHGAGLGLALCAKIVELHHGTMRFKSRVGQGTCVTVELKEGKV